MGGVNICILNDYIIPLDLCVHMNLPLVPLIHTTDKWQPKNSYLFIW